MSRWIIGSPGALLVILALINFINYVDRSVIGGVIPVLKLPDTGLGLDDRQIGILGGAFMIVHSVASIPLGYLADRLVRKRLISMGVAVWSVATALAGLATNFVQMFFARAAVGFGEATYAPAASALISERFRPEARARVLGVFQLGMVLGGAVGLVGGGYIGASLGWRQAFLIVGLPGLILAALVLFVHEPRRAPPPPAEGDAGGLLKLLRARPGDVGSWTATIWITLAGILTTFFSGALLIWGPEYIVRVHYAGDASHVQQVSVTFGPIVLVAGVLGVFAGSFIADRLDRARPGAGRLYTIAAGVLISAPLAALAFVTDELPVLYVSLGVGMFFNVWFVGPILAALHDVVPTRLRATITGAYFFLIHALGDAISPIVVGLVAKATGSLSLGLLLATGLMAFAGAAALLAVPASRAVARLKRDARLDKIGE
jgi:MFS family permease